MIRATVYGVLLGVLLTAGDPAMPQESHERERPRIAIAGLAIESSTFSPARTREEDFQARTGDRVLEAYPFLASGSDARKRAR